MTCTHCGQVPLTRAYSLRFADGPSGPRVIDLHLCESCLWELCDEDGIELAEDVEFVLSE